MHVGREQAVWSHIEESIMSDFCLFIREFALRRLTVNYILLSSVRAYDCVFSVEVL